MSAAERGGRLPPDAVDELRASLASLRGELERRFPIRLDPPAHAAASGAVEALPAWLQRLGDADPVRLLDRLRRRIPLPGPGDVSDEVDEFGLDARYLDAARPLLDALYERWWRVEVAGIEDVPDAPRIIFVANRSGVLPYDALMVAHALEREHPSRRRPRFLLADYLMTRPFLRPTLERLGGVRACVENAERLLDRDGWILVFPEGHKGALKPFAERYRLQRFGRGGFVTLAARRRALIVPVAVVGAEETHPLVGRWPRSARRSVPLTPTFPLLGPFGLIPLPSQWRIRFGEPVDLEGTDPELATDEAWCAHVREQVRATIQAMLDEEVDRRYSVWS